VVRFSRKNKEQYLVSEKDGKATGWQAFYRDGRWEPQEKQQKKGAGQKKASGQRKKKAS